MNTWLIDIIRKANERPFSEADVARMTAYYAKLPARLRLSEELERLESGLARKLHEELGKRYSDRQVYSRPLAQDLIESLRHVNTSILADDPRLLRYRWTEHLIRLLPELGVDAVEIRDAYLVLREIMEARLTGSSWDVFRPAFDEMLDALTAIPAPTVTV